MQKAGIAPFMQSVKMPVMPEVARALILSLSEPETDVATVTAIIAKDPGLTATLVRMANSALFGLSGKVDSLNQAVRVVGMSQIRARAVSICVANAFVFPSYVDRHAFWRSSMVCAGYARWLAAGLRLDEHQAWLCGMVLRLGEVLIGQFNPELLKTLETPQRTALQRWEVERSLTGYDEGQISAEIASRWDFPASVTNALKLSAQPLQADPFVPLAAVLHLAAQLADGSQVGAEELDALPQDVVAALALDWKRLLPNMPAAERLSDISMLQ